MVVSIFNLNGGVKYLAGVMCALLLPFLGAKSAYADDKKVDEAMTANGAQNRIERFLPLLNPGNRRIMVSCDGDLTIYLIGEDGKVAAHRYSAAVGQELCEATVRPGTYPKPEVIDNGLNCRALIHVQSNRKNAPADAGTNPKENRLLAEMTRLNDAFARLFHGTHMVCNQTALRRLTNGVWKIGLEK